MADWSLVLARFGEIGIKGEGTRRRFLARLHANLEESLAFRKVEAEVAEDRGRFYITARSEAGAVEAAAHTFGVVSASPALEEQGTMPQILARLATEAPQVLRAGQSFAIRARRTGDHDFSSMELAKEAGAAVWRAVPGVRVDLTEPDVELSIEVRHRRAFLFTRTVDGPGGLPVGTQGRVIAHASSPRDVAAAWLLLRRGCTVDVVLAADADPAPRAAVETLRRWWPRLRVAEDPAPRAEALRAWARRRRATSVAVGEGLAALAREPRLDAEVPFPVLRPLEGYTGERLAKLAARIGFAIPEEA